MQHDLPSSDASNSDSQPQSNPKPTNHVSDENSSVDSADDNTVAAQPDTSNASACDDESTIVDAQLVDSEDMEAFEDTEGTDSSEGETAPDSVPVLVDDVGPSPQSEEPSTLDPLEKALEDNARQREQMLRLAADFDNYRKRSRREIDDAFQRSKMDFLRELLPVFDNLERAVAHADTATDVKAVTEGVKMVLQQFIDTIGKSNVKRIDALGERFDPTIHEAVQQVESLDHAPGTVVADLLTGYMLGDRLVRASMVVVAKAPEEPTAPDTSTTDSSATDSSTSETVEAKADADADAAEATETVTDAQELDASEESNAEKSKADA